MNSPNPAFDAAFASRRIDPDPKRRAAAADDVWDLHDYESWRDEVWDLIWTFADQQVLDALLTDPPEYIVSDEMGWLEDKIRQAHGASISVFDRLMDALESRYRHLRAVHGTRTADVGTFYRNGLVPLDPLRMQQRARDLFMSPTYPELSGADVDRAIAAVDHETRSGRIYFEANETELVRRNGHYMLYGSEYLLAIAAHIGSDRDYRPDLKRKGESVVFLCDVPLSFLRPETLRRFAGYAIEALFEELLGEADGPSPTRNLAFSIHRPLPPDRIVGHYVPDVGRDAFVNASWR